MDSTQRTVTGRVRLKLYKGNIINAGVWSPYSLYNEDIATFSKDEVYNQKDAEGFINQFGCRLRVKAMLEKAGKRNNPSYKRNRISGKGQI